MHPPSDGRYRRRSALLVPTTSSRLEASKKGVAPKRMQVRSRRRSVGSGRADAWRTSRPQQMRSAQMTTKAACETRAGCGAGVGPGVEPGVGPEWGRGVVSRCESRVSTGVGPCVSTGRV